MKIEGILKQLEGKSLEFKKEIEGIDEEPLDLEEKLSSIIYDSIAPIPSVFFQTVAFENKIIFVIRILSGPNKPYYLKKLGPEEGVFVRIGSTNRKADFQVLAELGRQARNISLDQEIRVQKQVYC